MGEQNKCEGIAAHIDQCAFVTEACSDVGNLVDYLSLIYCAKSYSPVVGLICLCVWLVLLLSMLGTTADIFFVEQLEFISTRFNFSADVAGATLLAFGNGAPDVFTAWHAIQNASDFPLVLAELLGAAIFITTVVLGMVILCSRHECYVDTKPFARNAATLGLSVFAIGACVLDGSVQLVESGTIISFYIVYVLYIISSRPDDPAVSSVSASRLESNKDENDEGDSDEETAHDDPQGLLESYQAGHTLSLRGVHWSSTSDHVLSKTLHIFEWPFSLLRHLSIPAASFELWGPTRRRIAVCSVFGAVFVVGIEVIDSPSQLAQPICAIPLGVWLALMGASLAATILWRTSDTVPPARGIKTVLVVLGFISAIAWLDLLASETVAVFESLGAASGLSSAVLGCTLLAWGNCVGDLVADTAVARAGNPIAAIASVFNSPLFSQILAMGFAAGYYNVFHGALVIHVDNEAVLSFAAISLSLLLTSIVCACAGSRLPRQYAFVLFAIYAVYVILSLTLALEKVNNAAG